MPQYDYECDVAQCGAVKTIVCPVAEKPEKVMCPHCGLPMEQTYHPVGQVFKGSGWTPKFGPINHSKK